VGAHGQPYLRVDPPVVTGSGDGDAFLEPGESGTVALPVTSVGDVRAAGVTVTLRSSTPGVVVAPAVRDYGRIATGRTKRRRFEVTVPASVPLGSSLDLRATARFRGAYSPQTSVQHLLVGQPSTASVTATYSGPPIAVPDADETGASATVAVRGVGPVSAVTFSIDGTSCSTDEGSTSVGLDHTFVGDLVGTLTSPDGTTVTLFDHTGGEGNNLCKTVFTDTATRPIQAAGGEDAPFTGSWLPEEPLSTFLGGPGDGSWRFTAADTQPEDTGSVRAFSVRVRGFVQPPSS
jgi:subtilisin-like proprotein convertase family protein